MDHHVLMGMADGVAGLQHELQFPFERQVRDHRQGHAFDVLHHRERDAAVLAAIQQTRDAGVFKAREDLSLGDEPGAILG